MLGRATQGVRLIRLEMQYRPRPWAYGAFLLFAAVWIGGVGGGASEVMKYMIAKIQGW
ncbi:MAG: hypothetical protein HC927_12920 [Deltaproteobacteria bacterium]|nr:hypothetical protein [Deltaproteobacteria bacterium]